LKNFDRTTIILAGALALMFLISAVSYLIWGNEQEEQVLFFPTNQTMEARGEARILPRKDTKEQEIELLVKEVLLGPFNIDYMPVFPRDSRIRSIMLREDTLYIDFTIDVVFREAGSSLSLRESLSFIGLSIQFNFPRVRNIVYSINGNQLELTSEIAGS